MSLASWKAEFYPIEADKVPEDQAIAHSLRKWRGLTAENLERHGCEIIEHGVVSIDDEDDSRLGVSSETCALCLLYDESYNCNSCPLAQHLGHPCTGSYDESNDGYPYDIWYDTDNPLPMITALEAIALEAPAIVDSTFESK